MPKSLELSDSGVPGEDSRSLAQEISICRQPPQAGRAPPSTLLHLELDPSRAAVTAPTTHQPILPSVWSLNLLTATEEEEIQLGTCTVTLQGIQCPNAPPKVLVLT